MEAAFGGRVLVDSAPDRLLGHQLLVDQLVEHGLVFLALVVERLPGRDQAPRDGFQFDVADIDFLAIDGGGRRAVDLDGHLGFVAIATGAQHK